MPQLGIPLENQWARWPGVTYRLPVQCWVGPHHSAVITGVARAGIDALIELAGGKTPRGRTGALLCENPQVQDAVGRADATLNAGRAYRSAMIAELWNTVASGQKTTLEQRARCRLAVVYAPTAREAMDLTCRHGGSTLQAREPRRMLARPAHRRPDRHARARMVPDRRQGISGDGPRPAAPLAEAYNDCYRNPIDNHGIAAMINSEMTSAPM